MESVAAEEAEDARAVTVAMVAEWEAEKEVAGAAVPRAARAGAVAVARAVARAVVRVARAA